MNLELLEKAKEKVPSSAILINMISQRVRELNSGHRPYVKPQSPYEEKVDIALREISEGKIVAEMDFSQAAAHPTEN